MPENYIDPTNGQKQTTPPETTIDFGGVPVLGQFDEGNVATELPVYDPDNPEVFEQWKKDEQELEDQLFENKLAENKLREQERYALRDEDGDVIYDALTGQPIQGELGPLESIDNSMQNMILTIREFVPNIRLSSAVIARKLFGEEAVQDFIDSSDGSVWDEAWREGITDEDIQEDLREKELLASQRRQTLDVIESAKEGDVGGVVAGAVNAITSLGSSIAINRLTGGGGIYTDFFANSYVDYNTAKAERLGKNIEQLREDNEDSFWAPAAFSTLMGVAERFGLGKIGEAAKKSVGKEGARRAVNYLLAGTSEGTTEVIQTMLEKSQQELASTGDYGEAGKRFFTALGDQDTWEAGIQGFIGGAGFSGQDGESKNLRKAAYNLRDGYTQEQIDSKVQKKLDLLQKVSQTNDPQIRNILKQQIKDIDNSITRDVKESNDVVERLNDSQLEQVSKINKKIDAIKQQSQELDDKVQNGELDIDDYIAAKDALEQNLSTYKDQLGNIKDQAQEQPKVRKGAAKTEKYATEKGREISEATRKIYKEYGQAGVEKALELNKPRIIQLANSLWNPALASAEQAYTKADLIADIQSEYRKLYSEFNPEKNDNISAWINSQLRNRVIRPFSKGVKDFTAKLDDTGRGSAAEQTFDPNEIFESETISFGGTKKLADKLNVPAANRNTLEDIAGKVLTSPRIASIEDTKKFEQSARKEFREETQAEMLKVLGKGKNYESYINENWRQIVQSIPRSSMVATGTNDPRYGWKDEDGNVTATQEQVADYYLNRKPQKKLDLKKKLAGQLGERIAGQMASDLLTGKSPVSEKFKDVQEIRHSLGDKAVDIIDRAISLLDKYAKEDALNVGGLAAPAHVAIGGLRTLRAAVKAGQSLADAIEAGYQIVKEHVSESEWRKWLANQFNQHSINESALQEGLEAGDLENESVDKIWTKLAGGKTSKLTGRPGKAWQNNEQKIQEKFDQNLAFFNKNRDLYVKYLPKQFWQMLSIMKKDGTQNKTSILRQEDANALADESSSSKLKWNNADAFGRIANANTVEKLEKISNDPKYQKEVDENQAVLFEFGDAIQKLHEAGVSKTELATLIRTFINSGNPKSNIFRRSPRLMGYSSNISPEIRQVPEHNPPAGSIAMTVFEYATKGRFDQDIKNAIAEKFGYWQLDHSQDPSGAFVAAPTKGFNLLTDDPNIRYWAAGVDVVNTKYIDGKSVAEVAGIPAKLVKQAETNEDLAAAIQQAVVSQTSTQATKAEIEAYLDGMVENLSPAAQVLADKKVETDDDKRHYLNAALNTFVDKLRSVWPNVPIVNNREEAIKRAIEDGHTPDAAYNLVSTSNGFVSGGNWLYIDPNRYTDVAILNTAIHEFGHIWSRALYKQNPEMWINGLKALIDSPHWSKQFKRVQKNYKGTSFTTTDFSYLLSLSPKLAQRSLNNNPDLLLFLDEVLAGAIGDHAAGHSVEMYNNPENVTAWDNFLEGLSNWIKNLFGVESNTMRYEDFLNQGIGEILAGSKANTTLAKHIRWRSEQDYAWMNPMDKYAWEMDVEQAVKEGNIERAREILSGISQDKKESKKLSAFDFDDTLFSSDSKVIVNKDDGTSFELTPEQFATYTKKADETFDFGQFDQVIKPKALQGLNILKAKLLQGDDIVILTARTPKAGTAVAEVLEQHLGSEAAAKIKFKGVGHSSPEAKANYLINAVNKYGYNSVYFTDDAYKNIEVVKKALNKIPNLTNRVQLAKAIGIDQVDLDNEINKIIERKTGIKAEKRFGKSKARQRGVRRGFRFFLPASAEDFEGLLYTMLPKGKEGEAAQKFFDENLFKPFAQAMQALTTNKNKTLRRVGKLKKAYAEAGMDRDFLESKIPGSEYSIEQGIRAYLMSQNGEEDINGLSKADLKALVDFVNNNDAVKSFADTLAKRVGNRDTKNGYVPSTEWDNGTIDTDVLNYLDNISRAQALEKWQDNVDQIFSKENLNKIEAAYGTKYRNELEKILQRMRTGKNRRPSDSIETNRLIDWINGAVGATMFINRRSGVLQMISAVNFIGAPGNNIFKAAKAFANQPQFWKDVVHLFNSDFLVDRRGGQKFDIASDEIADLAHGKNPYRKFIAKAFKLGFTPTRLADSAAIALGGASFYRNRLKELQEKYPDKPKSVLEQEVMLEFQELAEKAQQSSRPDRISNIQASPIGRFIFAFANTPLQYARITKKAALDLTNGRGNALDNVSKMAWYGGMQAVVFTTLQNALFAEWLDDDDEEEELLHGKKKQEQYDKNLLYSIRSVADSWLRGWGLPGVVAATALGTYSELRDQIEKGRKDPYKLAGKVLQLSPPIASKYNDLVSAWRSWSWRQENEKIRNLPLWHRENPALESIGKATSAIANAPIDNVMYIINSIRDAADETSNALQKIALLVGYNRTQLGIQPTFDDKLQLKLDIADGKIKNLPTEEEIDEKLEERLEDLERKLRKIEGEETFADKLHELSPFNRLKKGEAGQAHRDGTIEIDPNLPLEEKVLTMVHEQQHVKDMEQNGLDYDDNNVYWKGKAYPRKDGKIKYNGKWVEEGHPDLIWEKRAYDAEKPIKRAMDSPIKKNGDKKVDPELKEHDEAADKFTTEWYNDPETRKRLKEQTGLSDSEIDERIAHATGVETRMALLSEGDAQYHERGRVLGEVVPEGEVGHYPGRIDVGVDPSGEHHAGILEHEQAHALEFDNKLGYEAQKILGKAKQDSYLDNPPETYANLQEFRNIIGLKPHERNLTPEKLMEILEWKKDQSDVKQMLENYDIEKLTEALNTIAEAKPKKQKSLRSLYGSDTRVT